MTSIVDPLVVSPVAAEDSSQFLRSRSWDRLFVVGGALLVPIPILAFYLFRSMGASVAAAEDFVTLLVMVPLGGPHVFATYTRTFFNPEFKRKDRLLWLAGFAVFGLVVTAAVASAFFDARIAGSPPMRFVLSFFFFWAGLHIVQQHSYAANGIAERAARAGRPVDRSRWNLVDYAVLLFAMYPVSLFRMSMADPTDLTMRSADQGALSSQIVASLAGDPAFADEYVFRIGRVSPILPEFLRSSATWITVTVLFVISVVLYARKAARQRREGTLLEVRHQLIVWMAVLGFAVPLFPNLDSAFQGLNAWHSFQYLGLLWLMNQHSQRRGDVRGRLFGWCAGEGRQWHYYGAGIAATLGLITVMLGVAWAIQHFSNGQFAMFGHDVPPTDPETGATLYRPGAVLMAYYLVAFGLLLVHYFHDGVFFFRRRLLVGGAS